MTQRTFLLTRVTSNVTQRTQNVTRVTSKVRQLTQTVREATPLTTRPLNRVCPTLAGLKPKHRGKGTFLPGALVFFRRGQVFGKLARSFRSDSGVRAPEYAHRPTQVADLG